MSHRCGYIVRNSGSAAVCVICGRIAGERVKTSEDVYRETSERTGHRLVEARLLRARCEACSAIFLLEDCRDGRVRDCPGRNN